MAQYKTFASKGSFSENQLKVPDESQKIVRAAERRIRGMNTAQAFLERNQELYLRAQQQAQNLEQATRESNFRMETENRKAFQELLRRDTETALANNEARAANTQQLYKSISSFSKTAFDLYQSFDEMQKKNAKGLATQNILESGLDVSSLRGLFALDKNLESSALRQTEFFQDLIKQGYSEDQLRAVERIYRSSAPQQYLNNQYSLQQESTKFASFYDAAMLEELPEGATVEQRKALSQQVAARFINQNYQGVRLDMLEASGVLKSIRSFTNQDLASYGRKAAQEREANLNDQFVTGVQTAFVKNRVAGVLDILQTSPSRDKRKLITEWAKTSVMGNSPNNLSIDEAQALLDSKLTIGNQVVAFSDQYPLEAGEISAAIRARRTRDMADMGLKQKEEEALANSELAKLADSFGVDDDKIYDQREVDALKQKAIQLGVPNSPVLDYVIQNSAPEFIRREQESQLTALLDAGRYKEAMAILSTTQVSQKIKNQFLPTVQSMMKMYDTPVVKSHLKSIEAAVSQDPRVKAAPITGASNYSVILMQDRFKRQYQQNLARLESPEEALSLTLQQIKTLQANPNAINNEGRYTEIEEQVQSRATEAGKSLKEYQDLLRAMGQKEFRENPKFAVDSVGAANFYNSYNSMSRGGQPNSIIKSGAEMMGVDPLTFINYLAEGAKVDPIEPKQPTLKDIKSQLPPVTRRLYDTYRTPERVNRANSTAFGGTFPVRGNVSSNERAALDAIARYESESAGGYDAVNQGGAEGGTRVLGYSGPFSLMPQHGNRPLTSLTIAEIMDLQADPGRAAMNMQEWFNQGKLHAVGRYQFIGSTLAMVVNQMGIDPNTKFTPDVQDKMALWLLRNSANGIGQWVGPANYATAQERAMINAVR